MADQELKAAALRIGGKYNWKNQSERLIYIGMCEPRNGRWHQFALIESPTVVWCEVLPDDLDKLEVTQDRAKLVSVPTVQAPYGYFVLTCFDQDQAQQVADSYKDDDEVFPLYAAPSQPVAGKPMLTEIGEKMRAAEYALAKPRLPSDEQMLAAFNSADSVIDGLHEVFALLTTANAGKDDVAAVRDALLERIAVGYERFFHRENQVDVGYVIDGIRAMKSAAPTAQPQADGVKP